MVPRTITTVTFDSDGGSEVGVQTVINGQKAAKPEGPTKLGYIFKGWYQVTDTGSMEDTGFDFENTGISGDITLRAAWRGNREGHYQRSYRLLQRCDQAELLLRLPESCAC